ncbi:MAG: TIGR03618 family F420-dependent PPOX class oxidoreductase [Chloroflexi bacterium]|nr:TIGR03618 family F420-dependent PPOX class oxidoreductase [Chloroflexota bacterium]MDA1003522.1 TIGR03618 family F420-dependent PPOX class oxidoreductase [Chloroflexota bacterium]
MTLTADQQGYLKEHRLGVLGTGRRDGSPQLSLIMYEFDGNNIVISVTSDRAKWKNAVRQPRVSVLVQDGRRQLIIYGSAQAVSDRAGIVAGHRRLRTAMGRLVEVGDDGFADELEGQHRVILQITPERAFSNE